MKKRKLRTYLSSFTEHGPFKEYLKTMGLTHGSSQCGLRGKFTVTVEYSLLKCEVLKQKRLIFGPLPTPKNVGGLAKEVLRKDIN